MIRRPVNYRSAIFLASLLFLGTETFAQESPKPHASLHWYWTGAGLALMAGGGMLAYLEHQDAERDMDMYRRSAFTGNTVEFRDRVQREDQWTWVGLTGAALGSLIVVVSF